jgi:NAD(P)-dependent dehydrogenase (short-subunit alcohol dehydrogenase family)
VTSFRLDGKVALVTGSARGLGEAIALALADAGADVAVLDLPASQAHGEGVAHAVRERGQRSAFFPADVTETATIPGFVERITAELGPIDILVNNAGSSDLGDALAATEADWDAIHALNLKATFFCAQVVAKQMIARGGGKIVNIGSPLGLLATGIAPAYHTSKGGVHSLTRELAFEWIKHGINVNAIAPGPIATPLMLAHDRARGATEAQVAEEMRRRVPLGRRLRADEVAVPVVFMASSAADALVGHLLVVDGGMTIF